ncbi:uncharacterized protein LOC143469504 [Clavelina lepadiformis]|uniref:uncharacterized protein LOC143469504 n=1 Tax=Clavelina lepadiformis TaxID=159417 RepID=UPI0040413E46
MNNNRRSAWSALTDSLPFRGYGTVLHLVKVYQCTTLCMFCVYVASILAITPAVSFMSSSSGLGLRPTLNLVITSVDPVTLGLKFALTSVMFLCWEACAAYVRNKFYPCLGVILIFIFTAAMNYIKVVDLEELLHCYSGRRLCRFTQTATKTLFGTT